MSGAEVRRLSQCAVGSKLLVPLALWQQPFVTFQSLSRDANHDSPLSDCWQV